MKPRSESLRTSKNNTKENANTTIRQTTPSNPASTTSGGTSAATISSCCNKKNNEAITSSVKNPLTSITATSSTQQPIILCELCPEILRGKQRLIYNVNPHQLLVVFYEHMEVLCDQVPSLSNYTHDNFKFCVDCQSHMMRVLGMKVDLQQIKNQVEEDIGNEAKPKKRGNPPGSSSMPQAEQLSSELKRLIFKRSQENRTNICLEENVININSAQFIEPSAVEANVEHSEEEQTVNLTSAHSSTSAEHLSSEVESDFLEQAHDEDLDELTASPDGQDIAASDNDDTESEGDQEQHNSSSESMDVADSRNSSMANSSIQIEQEGHAENVEEDDREEADVYCLTKRKLYYEGVEVYKRIDARSQLEYIHCSICRFRLPSKLRKTGKIPYMEMKTHILDKHKEKSGVPKQTRITKMKEQQPQRKSGKERISTTAPKTHGKLMENKQFKCQACNRSFERKCNLARHMGFHTRVSSKNNEPIPSTSVANRSGPRTRQAVGTEPIASTQPPPRSNIGNAMTVAGTSGSGLNISVDQRQPVKAGDGTVVNVGKAVLDLITRK